MHSSLWQMPLSQAQTEIAAAQPAPAGVATAAITAALGLSLLVKVLRITGKCGELLAPADQLIADLRSAADDDVDAVRTFMKTRDPRGIQEVPQRAAAATIQALGLCLQAQPHIKGLIAADVGAAKALLQGAADAIATCIAANRA